MINANGLVISTQDFNKSYGDIHALQSLDLKVPKNSIFAFLSPNRAGKTTAIQLLTPRQWGKSKTQQMDSFLTSRSVIKTCI